MHAVAITIVLVGAMSACGGDDGARRAAAPDAAAQATHDAGNEQLDAGMAAATFSELYATLFPSETNARCNFCHSMRASETSNGKLSVGTTQAAAYAALVGVTSTSTACGGMTLVDPGSPSTSLFLLKLMDPPPCGSRMPLGGAALTSDELERVRSWIAAGAKND